MDKNYFKKYKTEYLKEHKKVEVYLSLNEYEAFKKIAKERGYGNKVGKVVKEFAKNYKENSYQYPPELKEDLSTLTFLLRNVANNINQMAHISNATKQVVDDYKLFEYLKQMEDSIKRYVNTKIKTNDY
jgi:tRNA A37 threonylcarbamoyltransferase TsaD